MLQRQVKICCPRQSVAESVITAGRSGPRLLDRGADERLEETELIDDDDDIAAAPGCAYVIASADTHALLLQSYDRFAALNEATRSPRSRSNYQARGRVR